MEDPHRISAYINLKIFHYINVTFYNIFDSFYRGSNSYNINGSGLGLYICKKILQKMDVDIFAKIIKDEFCVTAVLRKM